MSWNINSNNFSSFQKIPQNDICSGNKPYNYNAKVEMKENEYLQPYELYQGSHQQQPCFQSSLKGSLEKTNLSALFFSSQNVDYIQNRIITEVYNRSNGKFQIGRQSDLQLQIVMRSVYLSEGKNLLCRLEQQVESLNKIVISNSVILLCPMYNNI